MRMNAPIRRFPAKRALKDRSAATLGSVRALSTPAGHHGQRERQRAERETRGL